MSEEKLSKLNLYERLLALPVYLVTLGAMLWFLYHTQMHHREFVKDQQAYSRSLAESGHASVETLAGSVRELSLQLKSMQESIAVQNRAMAENISKQNDLLMRQVAVLKQIAPSGNFNGHDSDE